jgi:predicted O-methyltransferase YrrM
VDESLKALLRELEERGRENDARETDRSRKMLNLDPDTALLISILVRASGATRALEIGTSNGYSTIWLAWSLARANGRVITVDRNPVKHELARENLRRAGMLDRVEFRAGDATEILRDVTGPFDVVFFDADRTKFPAQLEILKPKLASRVLLLADNATSHPDEIAEYLRLMDRAPEFAHAVIQVGKGLSIAWRG